ncbi:hypothetical protein O2V63_10365 [Modestobacter sp. VKM Ac-2977]|uniref:hypothetical protein n=1 Tax=Modestobacter sp. VKM Ac-2977 TaxID=3004131 RepID=UPI0022AB15B9|nr:hypothetical protein [Modestobacter sp. VKM Ac-2977]MCZ2820733.1 hypothetical protein [Modestobacter sp. VKM Ac-2977]
MADVVVEVGGWEHQCCGEAIERDQLVDLECIRHRGADGREHLVESHHDFPVDERVRGRVVDVQVVHHGGVARPVLCLPSGGALRGVDEDDDGHLEDPWTGEVITSTGEEFLVTVRTPR